MEYVRSNSGNCNYSGFTVCGKKLTRNTKCINQKKTPVLKSAYITPKVIFNYLSIKIINKDVKARLFPVLKMALVLFLHLISVVLLC